MDNDTVLNKSYIFAVKIVKLYKDMVDKNKEYVISKQLLRSGTSIGANITEGNYGFSKSDFAYKMSLALKEAYETKYWLRLIVDSDYIEENKAKPYIKQCDELCRMLYTIVKTCKDGEKNA